MVLLLFDVLGLLLCVHNTQVVNLQAEISYLQAHLATMELPSPPPPPPPLIAQPQLSIADLPSAPMPATYDLSSLFEPMVQPTAWVMQQRALLHNQHHQFVGGSSSGGVGGGGDLQALARELLHRHTGSPSGSVPCSEASPSRSLSK